MERPVSPRGWDVLQLRRHMKFNQTDFGSLLRIAQAVVSQWETWRRDDVLPPELAERFFDIWECFAERPPLSPSEANAVLAEYRRRKAALPAPVVTDPQQPQPQSWPIHFAQGPLPKDAVLVETGVLVPVDTRTPITRNFAAVIQREPSPERGAGPASQAPSAEGAPISSGERSKTDAGAVRPRMLQRFMLGHQAASAAALVLLLTPAGTLWQRGAAYVTGDAWGTLRSRVFDRDDEQMGEKEPEDQYVPKTPFPEQKLAPCSSPYGEKDLNGGCWVGPFEDIKPPCKPLFRYGNKCYRPVSKAPPKPVGSNTHPQSTRRR